MAQEPDKAYPISDEEMSIWEHLEELRWVVIRAVIGIVVGIIICVIFGDYLLNVVLLGPTKLTDPPMKLFNPEVFGQLSLYMKVYIWGGVIISFPHTLTQVWKFVAPGLHDKEKKYVGQITVFTILSFIAGLAFAYFFMLPLCLDYAAEFGSQDILNMTDIHKYLSLFVQIVIITGVIFELPVITFFLSKMGILTPAFMRHYRRHVIVGLLVMSALLSPGGDVVMQLALFVPLWALYEISIGSSAIVARQRKKAALADHPDTA